MAPTGKTPIAIFCYDRPRHLQITLDALARADDFDRCTPIVFADAPRTPKVADAVEQTRQVARQWLDRHGGELVERETNRGFHNITDGITTACDRAGRAFIVEDDIVVSLDFLSYGLAALDRYEKEPRVHFITGQMYSVGADLPDTFFLPRPLVWGWAVWASAWQRFVDGSPDPSAILDHPQKRYRFELNGGMPSFSKTLERVAAGRSKSWACRWAATVVQHDGIGLAPGRSLTWNSGVGCGVNGLRADRIIDHRVDFIHGRETRAHFDRARLTWPLDLPPPSGGDEHACDRLAQGLRQAHSPWRTGRRAAMRLASLITAKKH